MHTVSVYILDQVSVVAFLAAGIWSEEYIFIIVFTYIKCLNQQFTQSVIVIRLITVLCKAKFVYFCFSCNYLEKVGDMCQMGSTN